MAKGKKTGGRQKGTPNKVTMALKEEILEALKQAGGVQYLVHVAKNQPQAFIPLLGKILPLQVSGPSGEALPGSVTFVLVQQDGAENRT